MTRKQWKKKGPPLLMYRTHVTIRGQLYVPKMLGGVEFLGWEDSYTAQIKQNSSIYKKLLYIGIEPMRRLHWKLGETTKQAILIVDRTQSAGNFYRLELEKEELHDYEIAQ